MANPGAAFIEHVTGRLCAAPSSLASGSFPWGGTDLGEYRDARLRFRRSLREITAEEWGGMAVEVLSAGESVYLHGTMRRADVRTLSRMLLGAAAGATTGRVLVDPQANLDGERAGQIQTPFALYFSPDSDQHPGVLLYRAFAMMPDGAEWALRSSQDIGIPVVFVGTPDSTHERPCQIGAREDLTL